MALAGIGAHVAAADGLHVLGRDRSTVELAAATGKLVGTKFAGSVEVAVDVATGLQFRAACHLG